MPSRVARPPRSVRPAQAAPRRACAGGPGPLVPPPPVVPAPMPVPLPEPVPTAAADPGFDPLADDPFAPTSRQPGPAAAPGATPAATPGAARLDLQPEAPAVVIPTSSASRPAPTAPRTEHRRGMARPWLEIDGERCPLISAMTVLGRDESCDVLIEDPGVSRRHCEFRVTTDGPHRLLAARPRLDQWHLRQLRADHQPAPRPGDRVTVGRTSFTYRAGRR